MSNRTANKTINNIRFAYWEKASLSHSFSRYCRRYVFNILSINSTDEVSK